MGQYFRIVPGTYDRLDLIFCLIGSILIFAVVKYSIGLRVSEDEEIIGLDIGEHDMESYAGFQIFTVE